MHHLPLKLASMEALSLASWLLTTFFFIYGIEKTLDLSKMVARVSPFVVLIRTTQRLKSYIGLIMPRMMIHTEIKPEASLRCDRPSRMPVSSSGAYWIL